MSNFVRRFERNIVGRDFIVGDIHDHFTKSQQALDAISFDPINGRLFSVGGMVAKLVAAPETTKPKRGR